MCGCLQCLEIFHDPWCLDGVCISLQIRNFFLKYARVVILYIVIRHLYFEVCILNTLDIWICGSNHQVKKNCFTYGCQNSWIQTRRSDQVVCETHLQHCRNMQEHCYNPEGRRLKHSSTLMPKCLSTVFLDIYGFHAT